MPTALIVDDNGDNRYLLECILSAKGFDVISAANGLEALSRAENSLPDLVLSDILMPVMDGFSFCRQWKQSQRFKAIPFVFYTATYTDPKDEEFALSLGADLFIVKPADPDELVRLVQSVLERRAAGQLLTLADGPNDETPYLRQYNEVLIRKLEDKLLQVEKANQGLLVKDFAIASSRAGIAIADLDGCINYANAAFSRLWSKGNESLVRPRSGSSVPGRAAAGPSPGASSKCKALGGPNQRVRLQWQQLHRACRDSRSCWPARHAALLHDIVL